MEKSWVNSAEREGSDLPLRLTGPGTQQERLSRALREAIRDRRLAAGTTLPPYRSLAADLGLARSTVSNAYSELVAEGWLTARQGSGTRVAARPEPASPAATRARPIPGVEPMKHDLRPGRTDPATFPRSAWLASARRAFAAAPRDAFGPGDPRGTIELREAVASYVSRTRAVRASAENVVVCAGFGHGLRLLFGGVLRGPLAVEAYGLSQHWSFLAEAGVATLPMDIDDDGARVDDVAPSARSMLLTPAHQFPTGGPLLPSRRTAAVEWARSVGGVVIEDDYDGEFRYDRRPIGALQAMDPEHVVYIGSVSKSLSPAIRVGWMVLPSRLVDAVLNVKGDWEAWTPVPEQLILADMFDSGVYDRHVRRMRQRYRQRQQLLVSTLASKAPHIEYTGIAAGMHAVLRLPTGTESSTVEAARRSGLGLYGLSQFRHPQATMPHRDGVLVGYAVAAPHRFEPALDALIDALPTP